MGKILPKCDSAEFSQYEADFDENVITLLDMTPDQEMINEGVLRDLCNRVQRLRKEFKLVPTDDICVYWKTVKEDSKLNTLIAKSTEFMEANIKKPVKKFESTLTLKVKPKPF